MIVLMAEVEHNGQHCAELIVRRDLFSSADGKAKPRVTFFKRDLQQQFSSYATVPKPCCLYHTNVHPMVILKTVEGRINDI